MELSLQYRGKKFDIYAIVLNDKSIPAIDFLNQVKQNNQASHKSLVNIYMRHADYGPLKNNRKSRHIEKYRYI